MAKLPAVNTKKILKQSAKTPKVSSKFPSVKVASPSKFITPAKVKQPSLSQRVSSASQTYKASKS